MTQRHLLAVRRVLVISLVLLASSLLSETARATITQGDLSLYGVAKSRWAGRFGEGSVRNTSLPFSGKSGGSFAFDRWDLVEARQQIDLRPDYHFIKNYNMLGRLDTLLVKEADLFAIYRGWYDAFGDFKQKGVGEAANDFRPYTQREKVSKFMRDDLREYYAQVDVNDDLSFRIGKQQIIWTEADALSGTEVINPPDLRYHFIHFEAPEDQRRNLRMVKMNYVFGELWKTSNNELEAFWIPADFEGVTLVNVTDARDPYAITFSNASSGISGLENQEGRQCGGGTFHDCNPATPLAAVNAAAPLFLDYQVHTRQSFAHWHGLDKSEFGTRFSTLLPIGNGLQISFIYMYLARAEEASVDPFGPHPPCLDGTPPTCVEVIGPDPATGPLLSLAGLPIALPPVAVRTSHGIYGVVNTIGCGAAYKTRPGGIPVASTLSPNCPVAAPGRYGQLWPDIFDHVERAHYLGLTGTYYEKDLTDVIIRYDFSYQGRVGYMTTGPGKGAAGVGGPGLDIAEGKDYNKWEDKFGGVLAFDRPTLIRAISKQHTFIVAQWTTFWNISAHAHDIQTIVSTQGKLRHYQNLFFVAAVDWLWDGRLTTTNAYAWDVDTRAGFFSSTNTFRYSRNVILGANVQWYLGTSGRYTDPFTFSRDQRISEAEFQLVYEI